MGTPQIHAAVLHGIGQTPRYEPFPAPVAGDDEAVVTVTAAALKPSDRFMAKGVHYAPTSFPQVVGLDGVGRLGDGARVACACSGPPAPPAGSPPSSPPGRARAWWRPGATSACSTSSWPTGPRPRSRSTAP
jgi:hypothetical protein